MRVNPEEVRTRWDPILPTGGSAARTKPVRNPSGSGSRSRNNRRRRFCLHAGQRNPVRDGRTFIRKHHAVERRRDRQESANTPARLPSTYRMPFIHSRQEKTLPETPYRSTRPRTLRLRLLHGCDEAERVTIQAGIRTTSSVNMAWRVMDRAQPRRRGSAQRIIALMR